MKIKKEIWRSYTEDKFSVSKTQLKQNKKCNYQEYPKCMKLRDNMLYKGFQKLVMKFIFT